jgi:hypothetical protein
MAFSKFQNLYTLLKFSKLFVMAFQQKVDAKESEKQKHKADNRHDG